MRKPGEMSLRRAAQNLGVHYNTAKAWVHTGRLPHRRDATGHYWIPSWWIREVVAGEEPVQSVQSMDS